MLLNSEIQKEILRVVKMLACLAKLAMVTKLICG